MATITEQTLLGNGGKGLLPRSVSNEIWKEATAEAIVPSLAKAHPVILGENLIPVLTKRPAASIIGEGQNKRDWHEKPDHPNGTHHRLQIHHTSGHNHREAD
ncbi:hypothetical protein [Corynebacterium pyruviciproducens]|uniref:hypothetical protein n=1 Tax=Corynebacterium pyruviciproducens TaxID=598660 RepID=UPI0023F57753|nr:hypothetical protein [Corynebacterium pyruviciproducens]